MPDAFIYDHVRTPRGRGKADGALHEVTALNLATQTLAALKDRNALDPALVDDVVMGCVDPVGEAGGDIARVAAICAGYGNGVPGVQINRFCASGLDAVNRCPTSLGGSTAVGSSRMSTPPRGSQPCSAAAIATIVRCTGVASARGRRTSMPMSNGAISSRALRSSAAQSTAPKRVLA